ncbi:MAG: amidohydrolase family protein [Anaerolineae bacterium]
MHALQADLLVVGGTILTLDDRWTELDDGALAVADGAIVALGPRQEVQGRFLAREVLDASGRLVMPGLVNAHTHAPMTIFRGLADDLPLDTWLKEYIWPAEAQHVNPDMVYWGTLLAAAEMIQSGTVAFADMYFYEDDIGRAAHDAGIRCVLGEALVDFPSPNTKTPDEGLAYVRESFARWAGDPWVTVGLQPHSTYACSPDLLVRAKELADEFGAIYLIHAAETAQEVEDVRRRYGRSPVRHLEALGILDRRAVLAHGVHLTEEEIALVAERGASVAHCPESNMKLASGVAPVPALRRAGVNVALGTDGAASNNDLNLWGEMATAAKLHKVWSGDPTVASAREVVWMATRGGARALGLEDRLGSLEVGKRADFLCLDLDAPHMVPLYDAYSHLVYAARPSDVRTVVIEGRVVYDNGAWKTIDLPRVYAHVRALAGQLVGRWARDPNWRSTVGQ